MKKILFILLLITTTSCSHYNQQINLDLNLANKTLVSSNESVINLSIIDDRQNKEIIGVKKFGDEKIEITSSQNLTRFLNEEISQNLVEKGFKIGKGKNVEVHIITLKYKAKRGLPLGTSEAKSTFKIIVEEKAGAKFSKNYELSLSGKHFIVTLESTDSQIINSLLEQSLSAIVNDPEFLKALTK